MNIDQMKKRKKGEKPQERGKGRGVVPEGKEGRNHNEADKTNYT